MVDLVTRFTLGAMALATSILLAGCVDSTEAPHDAEESAKYLMIGWGGRIIGFDADAAANREACGYVAQYEVDAERKSVRYDSDALALPPTPEALVWANGTFSHPRPGCTPFQSLEAAGNVVLLQINFSPFSWAQEVRVEGDTLYLNGSVVPTGDVWTARIDEIREGIHYRGDIEVRNLGPWPVAGLDPSLRLTGT